MCIVIEISNCLLHSACEKLCYLYSNACYTSYFICKLYHNNFFN